MIDAQLRAKAFLVSSEASDLAEWSVVLMPPEKTALSTCRIDRTGDRRRAVGLDSKTASQRLNELPCPEFSLPSP